MSTLKLPVSASDHIQGNINAKIILVEYGDYECSYCGDAYPIVKKVQKHFGTELGFVFRNFPLNESHPHAEIAAETAEFAAAHGKFWKMHDLLYENQKHFNLALMLKLAESLNLSATDLEMALKNKTFQEKVKNDFMSGVKSGVNGTPAFYINGVRHDGSFDYADLVQALT
jgi:protein-disulfide isomerase